MKVISRAELEDSEDLAKHETGQGARRMAGCWWDVLVQRHWWHSAVTNQLPLISMVMSIKITFFDNT